jgi:uncharacterized protein (TIGR03435 family)
MRQNQASHESLEHRLGRYAHPVPSDAEADIDSAWENIKAESKWIPLGAPDVSLPLPHDKVHRSWRLLTAAFAIMCAAVLSIVLWPGGSAAVVVAADNGLYRIVNGKPQALKVGERVRIGQTIRSEGMASTTLAFTDGARVEMSSMSEISLEDAVEGFRIQLHNGSVIANAEKQEAGRQIYIATRDVTVPVVGGVLLVKADDKGSSVGAIKGEADVQPNQKLEDRALQVAIGWSREAASYLAILHESLEQKLAAKQSAQPAPSGTSVPDKPQFEEVSIRRCEENFQAPAGMRGGGSNSLRLSPGRLDALCMTPATLIRTAFRKLNNNSPALTGPLRLDSTYGLGRENGTRVRGGPDWVRSERYTIAAVASGRTDASVLGGPMLFSLLESRFRLKTRVDTEEIPVWALKVAKSGLKIRPSGACYQIPLSGRPPDAVEMRQLEEARGAKPFCQMTLESKFPNTKLTLIGGTLSQLAAMLSNYDGPRAPKPTTLEDFIMVNRTGIPDTELFDLVLEYGPEPEGVAETQPAGPLEPPIRTALGKLGLTLERSKGSREFVVIDHIERPSEN